jgi:hypothetical protein
MLGRKEYTRVELERAEALVERQLAAYDALVEAIADGGSNPKADAALKAFEQVVFNNLTLALDRFFVHRLRVSAGNDGNPLNEVELLTDSLINNGGHLRGNKVVKYDPTSSVVGLELGDTIQLTAVQFRSLARAFLAEIERRFV